GSRADALDPAKISYTPLHLSPYFTLQMSQYADTPGGVTPPRADRPARPVPPRSQHGLRVEPCTSWRSRIMRGRVRCPGNPHVGDLSSPSDPLLRQAKIPDRRLSPLALGGEGQ